MKINTTRFGPIEIDDDAIISMPDGMIGFEQYKSYCLIDHQPESILKWLQSIHNPDVAFLVMDPSDVAPDYEVELPDWDAEFLGLTDPADAVLISTVTIDADANEVTTNLLAPIVVNAATRLGRQVVLDSEQYALKHPICALIADARAMAAASKAA